MKVEKKQYLNKLKNLKLKVKINKHNKYTVTKRCSEKTAVLKTDQDPWKITKKVHF